MPTFEAYILGAPPRFIAGCRALNNKFKNQTGFTENFRFAVVDIVKMGYISSPFSRRSEVHTMDVTGVWTYLTSSWISSSPRPIAKEAASLLDLNTALSRDVIEAFVRIISEVIRAEQSVFVTSVINLAKVDKLQWKLGVTVGSNMCAGILSCINLFATMILCVTSSK
jgi:hypothetical protein